MVGKLQVDECALGGPAWNALLAVPFRFRRLRTQRRVSEGPLCHIQGGRRARVSVFSFVKVNRRGNFRTEEGTRSSYWSKEQKTQATTYRARGYEKEGGESLESQGYHHSLDLRDDGTPCQNLCGAIWDHPWSQMALYRPLAKTYTVPFGFTPEPKWHRIDPLPNS